MTEPTTKRTVFKTATSSSQFSSEAEPALKQCPILILVDNVARALLEQELRTSDPEFVKYDAAPNLNGSLEIRKRGKWCPL